MPWYQISVPVAGGAFRVVWGPNPDAALAGARTELKTRWGVDDRYFDSFISPTIQEVAPDGPPPQGSAELTWGPPRDYTGPGIGRGTSGGTGGGTGGGVSGGFPLESESPFAAFLRGLETRGVPTDQGTYAGRYATQQFQPSLNAFRFSDLLHNFADPNGPFAGLSGVRQRTPEETQSAYQNFVANTGLYGGPGEAANILTGLRLAGTVGGGANPAAGLLPNFPALRSLFNQPDEQQARELTKLGQSALSSRVSPLGMDLLNLPDSRYLRGQFLNQGGGAGSFLDFLRKQLGLTSIGL